MKTNLFVGYEWPAKETRRGIIYLNGYEFANVWYNPEGYQWGKLAGKWSFNRSSLAISMDFYLDEGFDRVEDMLKAITNKLENGS